MWMRDIIQPVTTGATWSLTLKTIVRTNGGLSDIMKRYYICKLTAILYLPSNVFIGSGSTNIFTLYVQDLYFLFTSYLRFVITS